MPLLVKPSHALASLALAAAVSGLALATAGHAQPPPPRQPPPGAAAPRPGMPNRDAMRAQVQQRMAARRAERDRDLATVLRLRPDQMPALQAFVASQTPQRMAPPPAPNTGPPGSALTTPQRLDRESQRSRAREAERDAARQRREQGLRTFYGALSPDQQQVFDALTRLRDSHGGRGGRGGHHGMRGGPKGPMMGGPGMDPGRMGPGGTPPGPSPAR